MIRNLLFVVLLPSFVIFGNDLPLQTNSAESSKTETEYPDVQRVRSIKLSIEVKRDDQYNEQAWKEMVETTDICLRACHATDSEPLSTIIPQAIQALKILLANAEQDGFEGVFILSALDN